MTTEHKTKKHPADGFYFLNLQMLRKAGACNRHLYHWEKKYGKADILITKKVVLEHEAALIYHSSAANWALKRMCRNGKITKKEFEEAYKDSNKLGDPKINTRHLMNVLAKRTRREGRLV